jgi:putative spermidine/putrescine transport system substrate-binding protein
MRARLLLPALLGGALLSVGAAEAAESITIASWGGVFQKAQRAAWFDAVEKELGITVKEDTTQGIADIRAQVASGKPTWDVVDQGNYTCAILEKEGLLEKLDPAITEMAGIAPSMKGTSWVSNLVYAEVLAWRTAAYKEKAPEGWAAMWDTKNFPGGRSMRKAPVYNLEAALLVDGVPMDKLYPLDVDRAFKKLQELKPHITAWWSSGAQSAQLLQDGEVDMVGLWNGRVQSLMEGANKDKFNLTFNQQMLLTDCWLVPKGAPHKELAMKAIAIMQRPDIQAQLPLHINYAPANEAAYETGIIKPEIADGLPNSPKNRGKGFVLDPKYWAEHLDELTKRFDQFVQE